MGVKGPQQLSYAQCQLADQEQSCCSAVSMIETTEIVLLQVLSAKGDYQNIELQADDVAVLVGHTAETASAGVLTAAPSRVVRLSCCCCCCCCCCTAAAHAAHLAVDPRLAAR